MSKLALITGASSGIGAETAHELSRLGMRVVLVARDRTRLAAAASSIGPAASLEVCDAASGDAVLALAERVRTKLGTPDIIINCAGLGQWKRIEDTQPSEALSMIGAPYLAAFNITHAFMREMLARKSGIIIHVNSPACYSAWPGAVGYIAARSALKGMHEALRQDLVGTGVRSCHVIFGKVSSSYFEHNPGVEKHMPGIANTIRTLTPVECARVLAKVALCPRDEVIHPFLLRVYKWNNDVAPWLTRWLLLKTGARRIDA